MRILYLVPYVPNLIYVRPYNLLKFLSSRGHKITLITLAVTNEDRANANELKKFCQEVHCFDLPKYRSYLNSLLALPSNKPLQSEYCWQPEIKSFFVKWFKPENFDIIHIEHLRGAKYGLLIQSLLASARYHSDPMKNRKPLIVYDSVDCISLLFSLAANQSRGLRSRLLTGLELGRTKNYERMITSKFDRVLVTSSRDKEALLELGEKSARNSNISVLPNGVDLAYFTPGNFADRVTDTLIISGKMSYHANVTMVSEFMDRVMPLIWDKRNDIKIIVVGKDPPPEIRAYGKDPRVTITGTVPDIRPFLQKSTISVAPIKYGVGIQNKVLEAMACGLPVVSSSQACSALMTEPGRDLYLADTPEDFAAKVLMLLSDSDLRFRLGKAGREYVETHHQWSKIVENLEMIYQENLEKL